jgi:phosphatidylserine/phosphatidylglycerophosphate/cardiolipin synthase-like enzyme
MRRSSKLVRESLNKYKKWVLLIFVLLLIFAYPAYLLSQKISSYFVVEINYRPGEEVNVDYDLDISIYDNFFDTEHGKFSDITIRHIDNAKHEIYIAMYSFNIAEIRDALESATDRGVSVKILYNHYRIGKLHEFLEDKIEKFDITYLAQNKGENDQYHMHHKFMIIDPGYPDEILLTGPWNWSYFQEDLDPNILMEIRDKEIISSYLSEFNRLQQRVFGYRKFSDLTYIPWDKKIIYPNGDVVEIWWSPGRNQNSIERRIIDIISQAEESIDIGVTIFDSQNIAIKVLDKAKEGVEIRITVNASTIDCEDSMIPWIQTKIDEREIDNISIFSGGTLPTEEMPEYSIFHHNNLIVDNKIVLTGTANWTFGGFFLNDENTLVYFSPKVAEKFAQIYDDYLQYSQEKN